MTEFFIVLGVLALSFALRSFDVTFLRKLGALGILVSTFLVFYYTSGNICVGIGGVLGWFLLPWVELLTRIRKMRLPVEKTLEKQAPPNSSRFPSLHDFTNEIEEEEFEYICDSGWEWEGVNQFYRVFYFAEERLEASICFTEQESVAWAYVSLTSRHEDGRIFRTSNLPFSNPMKIAPEVLLRQLPHSNSFLHLLEEHRDWMEGLAFEMEDFIDSDPEEIPRLIEAETVKQVRHNFDSGLITSGETEETFRYSWRGLFYLYFQLVKDMVKMC